MCSAPVAVPRASIVHSVPVMTPDGWIKHGDLRIGCQVYAADGSITTVTGVGDEIVESSYRITFRDGSIVDCAGTQSWPVDVFKGDARARRIVTAVEMLAEGVTYHRPLTTGKTKATRGGVARFRTLPSPAIIGQTADLGIDPYVLGYWLGDGDSDCARVTGSTDDLGAFIAQLDRLGIEHAPPSPTHGDTHRMRIGGGAQKALRTLGVLNSKRIPSTVLRASLDQRWSVIQGIVDTDGTVSPTGQVEICVRDNRLGNDIYELAISLGLMPTKTYRNVTRMGRTYGPYVRIKFHPQPGEVVCRISRKLVRCKTESKIAPVSRSRTVVSIEEIEPAPSRPLVVAHEGGEYLVGAHNVPTCAWQR